MSARANVSRWLERLSELSNVVASPGMYRLLLSAALLVVTLLLRRFVTAIINRRIEDANRRHVFRKIANYCAWTLLVLALVVLWIQNLTFITAVAGFLAAGLAIALRDVLMSFFGWFKILLSRPFRVGDRIEVQQLQGDVIDITPLHTVVLELGNWIGASQSTGRIVYIPNNIIFLESVYNASLGFPYLWDEFAITVTFESDLDVAESLLKEPMEEQVGINYRRARREIQRLGDQFAIQFDNLTPRVYTSVSEHGVTVTLRYMTRVRRRREIKSRLSRRIMELLNEHPDVELAYPTYRVFRRGEGEKDADAGEGEPGPPTPP